MGVMEGHEAALDTNREKDNILWNTEFITRGYNSKGLGHHGLRMAVFLACRLWQKGQQREDTASAD